jgi:DNA-binding GntR family transcriptional regulator
VAEVLREAILRGLLKGGDQLRQDEVATQLGVSRIPVREGLRQLEAEGLVKFLPRRGVLVSSLSADEVQEIYDMRIPLECTALRLALPHVTDADVRRAEDLLGAIDQETDIERWGQLNDEFHAGLYGPANRPRLLALIKNLRANVGRYLRIYISLLHHKPRSQKEHREILDAVKRRDTVAALAALERHLDVACRGLVAYLSQDRDGPGERAGQVRSR